MLAIENRGIMDPSLSPAPYPKPEPEQLPGKGVSSDRPLEKTVLHIISAYPERAYSDLAVRLGLDDDKPNLCSRPRDEGEEEEKGR